MTLSTVSKRYQGTGILKSDCQQPLRIGIIRALNECTGRRFSAATRHNHKSSDMQSKKISNDQEMIQSDPTNLNSAERLFSMNFPSKYASFEITFILILFLNIPNEFVS